MKNPKVKYVNKNKRPSEALDKEIRKKEFKLGTETS